MDVVYIVGKGLSPWADNELRYSIRSLKHIEYDKLHIIGFRPHFLDCKEIECEDPFKNKQSNAIYKILKACDCQDISEDFILMNDDFFFLEDQEVKTLIREDLKQMAKKYVYINSKYKMAIDETIEYLKENDLGFNNFEVHYPMIINKYKFKELFKNYDYLEKPILYRSIYGNTYNLNGEFTEDFKAFKINEFEFLKRGKFLSTDDSFVRNIFFIKWLNSKFPEKSRYEV